MFGIRWVTRAKRPLPSTLHDHGHCFSRQAIRRSDSELASCVHESRDCRAYFTVFTNTSLKRIKIDIRKGIASVHPSKGLATQQRTACYMMHRLRLAHATTPSLLPPTVSLFSPVSLVTVSNVLKRFDNTLKT